MKFKKRYLLLLAIVVASFSIRAYFSVQSDRFSDTDSYFHLRQIENIKRTGFPLFEDDLSQGGRLFIFLPVFHYIVAGFSVLFPGILPIKLFNDMVISFIPVLTYAISSYLVKRRKISILISLMSAFIPILHRETVNSLNPLGFVLVLMLTYMFLYLQLQKDKKYSSLLIGSFVLLSFSTHWTVIIIIGSIAYFAICYLEKIKLAKREYEIIFFSTILLLWVNFIIYKNAFQMHGLKIIWQNIPKVYMEAYFSRLNTIEVMLTIGIIPLIFGLMATYQYLFKKKNEAVYLILGYFLATFTLLWLKLIKLVPGITLLGIFLIIMTGLPMRDFFLFISKTRFHKIENAVYALVIILIILTSTIPSILSMSMISQESITGLDAYAWLKLNTKISSTILATPLEGHLITYFGERKNVLDTNYLMVPDIDVKYNDTRLIYKTAYLVDAVRLLEKYDVDYIMLSDYARSEFKIDRLGYADAECLSLVYNSSTLIYRNKCELEEE